MSLTPEIFTGSQERGTEHKTDCLSNPWKEPALSANTVILDFQLPQVRHTRFVLFTSLVTRPCQRIRAQPGYLARFCLKIKSKTEGNRKIA